MSANKILSGLGLAILLSACGGGGSTNSIPAPGDGNGGGGGDFEPQTFFENNLQSAVGFCRTCHIPGGVGDVDDGRAFMLSSNMTQDYQNFFASWQGLGGGVTDNAILVEASDASEPHSGGKPWPVNGAVYQAVETLFSCWDDPVACTGSNGDGGGIELEPLIQSAHGGHGWVDFCEANNWNPDAELPVDPRSLVRAGYNDGRAVYYNAFWRDCHMDPELVGEYPHPETCGEFKASIDRGAVIMGEDPMEDENGEFKRYPDWLNHVDAGAIIRPATTFGGDNPHPVAALTAQQYNNLWITWGLPGRPDNFDELVAERYGFGAPSAEYPYPVGNEDPNATNGGSGHLPYGLIQTRNADGSYTGEISTNCQGCHSVQIGDQFHNGAGGAMLDATVSSRDFAALGSIAGVLIDRAGLAGRVRGTNNAQFSNITAASGVQSETQLADVVQNGATGTGDTPAWWNVGRRPVKFVDAMFPGDAVRVDYALFTPLLTDKQGIPDQQRNGGWVSAHVQDGDHYIMSRRSPEYPGTIDMALAEQGAILFHSKNLWADGLNTDIPRPMGGNGSCASCHGAYSPRYINDTAYLRDPALEGIASYVVPLAIIQTDSVRSDTYNEGTNEANSNTSVGYPETQGVEGIDNCGVQNIPGMQPDANGNDRPIGYAAPPLYGVWATAPYLHNGSVPDMWGLLKSSERPSIWKRQSKEARADQVGQVVMGFESDFSKGYNQEKMGWNYEVISCEIGASIPAYQCDPLGLESQFFLSELYGSLLGSWNVTNPPTLSNDDIENRKIYNTAMFSQGNGGHVFSDVLTDQERLAIIEYLKTL
ncbi:hypothetical protein IB286_07635 [Spongiibacter sp. KMU-158]|uniref:Cytochrome c domain-containing protein n=1 Tax=Spongiibacter pelagi TaxID=2760804 RepID=A0A927C2Z3_9GAMM|nr:hypothetical protein [Spongiibacter pelagi]MBD2858882.1 hypothetical protein [Spongiibacter pelagi]